MSNVSDAVRKIGEEIVALAEMMEHKAAAPAADEASAPAAEEKPTDVAIPKLEDVRAVLAEISRKGKTAEMKALLTKFGAAKLSDINPSDYPSLLAAAKEVQNA